MKSALDSDLAMFLSFLISSCNIQGPKELFSYHWFLLCLNHKQANSIRYKAGNTTCRCLVIPEWVIPEKCHLYPTTIEGSSGLWRSWMSAKLLFPPSRCFARPSPAARLHLPLGLERSVMLPPRLRNNLLVLRNRQDRSTHPRILLPPLISSQIWDHCDFSVLLFQIVTQVFLPHFSSLQSSFYKRHWFLLNIPWQIRWFRLLCISLSQCWMMIMMTSFSCH